MAPAGGVVHDLVGGGLGGDRGPGGRGVAGLPGNGGRAVVAGAQGIVVVVLLIELIAVGPDGHALRDLLVVLGDAAGNLGGGIPVGVPGEAQAGLDVFAEAEVHEGLTVVALLDLVLGAGAVEDVQALVHLPGVLEVERLELGIGFGLVGVDALGDVRVAAGILHIPHGVIGTGAVLVLDVLGGHVRVAGLEGVVAQDVGEVEAVLGGLVRLVVFIAITAGNPAGRAALGARGTGAGAAEERGAAIGNLVVGVVDDLRGLVDALGLVLEVRLADLDGHEQGGRQGGVVGQVDVAGGGNGVASGVLVAAAIGRAAQGAACRLLGIPVVAEVGQGQLVVSVDEVVELAEELIVGAADRANGVTAQVGAGGRVDLQPVEAHGVEELVLDDRAAGQGAELVGGDGRSFLEEHGLLGRGGQGAGGHVDPGAAGEVVAAALGGDVEDAAHGAEFRLEAAGLDFDLVDEFLGHGDALAAVTHVVGGQTVDLEAVLSAGGAGDGDVQAQTIAGVEAGGGHAGGHEGDVADVTALGQVGQILHGEVGAGRGAGGIDVARRGDHFDDRRTFLGHLEVGGDRGVDVDVDLLLAGQEAALGDRDHDRARVEEASVVAAVSAGDGGAGDLPGGDRDQGAGNRGSSLVRDHTVDGTSGGALGNQDLTRDQRQGCDTQMGESSFHWMFSMR